MNRFNLTFSGKILTGLDPAEVKLRFGKMFSIEDPVRLERFFTGQTIILRRDLERKTAAQYFRELHELGMVAELVKVTDDVTIEPQTAAAQGAPATPDDQQSTQPMPPPPLGSGEQTWPVSASLTKRDPQRKKVSLSPKDKVKTRPGKTRQKKSTKTARIKARKEEALRLAAQEPAVTKIDRTRQPKTDADTRRKKSELANEKCREIEEAARRKAELEEKKQHDADKAARRKAELEAKKQHDAEESAKRLAKLEEKNLRDAEKSARRKAELEEKNRLEAEKAAKRKAELEERMRRDAEEAAERKAELEKKKRRDAEKAVKRKAELEEKKRRDAEKAAKRRAELEEKKRRDAEAAARRKAEIEEKKRIEAEKAMRLAANIEIMLREDEEAFSKLQTEIEEIESQAKTALAKIRAEALQKKTEAERKSDALRKATAEKLGVPLSPRTDMAQELQAEPIKEPVPKASKIQSKLKSNAKTTLERPSRDSSRASEAHPSGRRRRQAGEPNLYKLRPFRNTDAVRTRAQQARSRMQKGFTAGALALITLLIAGTGFIRQSESPRIGGADGITINPLSGPLIMAGDSLLAHDRAGNSTDLISLASLNVSSMDTPIAFSSQGEFFALGHLQDDSADLEQAQLLQCDLANSACLPFSPHLLDINVDAFTIHPLDNTLILADVSAGLLLKVNKDKEIAARANVALPDSPTLNFHAGLLLITGTEGPAISVFRYEDDAFGLQLDEIILLPPTAQKAAQSKITDFLWSGGAWWVSMQNPETKSAGVYRFDDEWNYLNEVEIPFASDGMRMASWRGKTLIYNPLHTTIHRFNSEGTIEAEFVSTQLQSLIGNQQKNADLSKILWRCGLLVLAGITVLGLGFGYLQYLRNLVYKAHRERGADPVDSYAGALDWVEPSGNRRSLMRRKNLSYGLLIFATMLLAIGYGVTVWQLAALLVVLSGPAVALLILSRQPIGHIGSIEDKLLLVDHSGMYHIASGSGVLYRGPFMFIDDVVVFSGNRFLPAFSLDHVQKLVRPLTASGIKVDRKTVLVKLLQAQHPLAQGTLVILVAVVVAALLLFLHSVF